MRQEWAATCSPVRMPGIGPEGNDWRSVVPEGRLGQAVRSLRPVRKQQLTFVPVALLLGDVWEGEVAS